MEFPFLPHPEVSYISRIRTVNEKQQEKLHAEEFKVIIVHLKPLTREFNVLISTLHVLTVNSKAKT